MIEKIRFGLELIQKSGFAVKGWVRMPRKLKSFAVIIIALHIIWLGFAVFCIWTNTNEKNVRQPEEKQGQIVFENENIEYQFSLIIQENTESEEKSFLDIIDFKDASDKMLDLLLVFIGVYQGIITIYLERRNKTFWGIANKEILFGDQSKCWEKFFRFILCLEFIELFLAILFPVHIARIALALLSAFTAGFSWRIFFRFTDDRQLEDQILYVLKTSNVQKRDEIFSTIVKNIDFSKNTDLDFFLRTMKEGLFDTYLKEIKKEDAVSELREIYAWMKAMLFKMTDSTLRNDLLRELFLIVDSMESKDRQKRVNLQTAIILPVLEMEVAEERQISAMIFSVIREKEQRRQLKIRCYLYRLFLKKLQEPLKPHVSDGFLLRQQIPYSLEEWERKDALEFWVQLHKVENIQIHRYGETPLTLYEIKHLMERRDVHG